MASTTTRAALPYPTLPDTPDVPRDVKALADRLALIEGAPTYTSSTRPTPAFEGQLIFESDTSLLMRYDGTTWRPLAARGWKSYTTAWTNGPGGGGLAIGSGTLEGFYIQVGDLVHYYVRLGRASDTNLGTTGYAFTLPVDPASFQNALGAGTVQRSGSGMPFVVMGTGGSTVVLVIPGTSTTFGTRVGSANPGSWAAGDVIAFGGTYRAATAV